jgi:hypothetical protein
MDPTISQLLELLNEQFSIKQLEKEFANMREGDDEELTALERINFLRVIISQQHAILADAFDPTFPEEEPS